MSASPAQRAKRERDKVAALAMRRQGMTAPAVAAVLGCTPRKIRDLCEGESLDPPKSPGKSKRRRLPLKRREDRFKRRHPRPFLLDAPTQGGGFGLLADRVPDPGGPSIPVDGWGDPMGDGRHLQKVAERIIDITPTPQDERTWDDAEEFDPDDPEIDDLPPGRVALLMESGEVREL